MICDYSVSCVFLNLCPMVREIKKYGSSNYKTYTLTNHEKFFSSHVSILCLRANFHLIDILMQQILT